VIEIFALKNKIGIRNVLSFAIPALTFIEINIIGRLFLSELLLLLIFIFLLFINKINLNTKIFRNTFILLICWFISQVVTDIFRGTDPDDFLRGWSNIFFFLIELLVVNQIINGNEKRIYFCFLGIVLGQLLQYIFSPNKYAAEGEFWKFGIGYPLTILAFLYCSTKSIWNNKVIYTIILIIVVSTNFFLNARSLAAVSLLALIISLYTFDGGKKCKQKIYKSFSLTKILLIILFVFLSSQVYSIFILNGYAGEEARNKYLSQSSGKLGIIFGGRQELLVSSIAIIESPILGHGSWARDPKYIEMLPDLLTEYGYEDLHPFKYDEDVRRDDFIPTHSHIFGAWVYSGIFGAIFWLYILFQSFKIIFIKTRLIGEFTPIINFSSILMIWNILFSPFGAETRVYTSFTLVIILYFISKNTAKVGIS
jgi:hypothetical protein